MRSFPALDLIWAERPPLDRIEQVLAWLDDDSPTAVEDRPDGVRVFFAEAADRDRAAQRLRAIAPDATCAGVDVPDEDWAARSQSTLRSIRVGRFVISPPWDRQDGGDDLQIVIQPSMGFGTGHHPSTRLCLQLLQRLSLDGRSVLDAGTGSGVLALAAARLGATCVVGIDTDPDALGSAGENIALNGLTGRVVLERIELGREGVRPAGPFDAILANLTGAMLVRQAPALCALTTAGGTLIVSGVESHEAEAVIRAFAASHADLVDRADDGGWVGLMLRRSATSPSASTAS